MLKESRLFECRLRQRTFDRFFLSRKIAVILCALGLCLWTSGCADRTNEGPKGDGGRTETADNSKAETAAPDPHEADFPKRRSGRLEAESDVDGDSEQPEPAPVDSAESFGRIAELKEELFAATDRLIASYPDKVQALGAAAIVQWRFGKKSEAEALWKECIALDDRFVDAYHGLGDLYLDTGEYERAIEHYREVLRLHPDRPDAHHRLAEALIGAGEMAEAVELLENRIQESSGNAETYFWLGQACLQLEDYEKAVEYHKVSIGIDPQNTYSYYGLATAFRRLGRREEASQFLEDFRRLKKQDRQAEFDRLETVNDYRTTASSAAFLWSALAKVHAVYGNLAVAEEYWRNARNLDPADKISRQNLVSLYGRGQRLAEAVAVLEELCEIDPAQVDYHRALGVFRARMGEMDAARTSLQEALRLDPKNAGAHATLAHVLLEAGRNPSIAVDHARKAVELRPIAPHYMVLSQAAAENGDLVLARTAAREAVELAPNNPAYEQALEALEGKGKP